MGDSHDRLIKAIKHYQDSLEKHMKTGNKEKMLHAIEKLSRLPIQLCHLEETGIGRTVNSMKKIRDVREDAAVLVNKWKSMVQEQQDLNSKSPERNNGERKVESGSESSNSDKQEPDETSLQVCEDEATKESDRQNTESHKTRRSKSKDRHGHRSKRARSSDDESSSSDNSESKHKSKKHKSHSEKTKSSHRKRSDSSDSDSSDDSNSSRSSDKSSSSESSNSESSGNSSVERKSKKSYSTEKHKRKTHSSSSDDNNHKSREKKSSKHEEKHSKDHRHKSDSTNDRKRSSSKEHSDSKKHEKKHSSHSISAESSTKSRESKHDKSPKKESYSSSSSKTKHSDNQKKSEKEKAKSESDSKHGKPKDSGKISDSKKSDSKSEKEHKKDTKTSSDKKRKHESSDEPSSKRKQDNVSTIDKTKEKKEKDLGENKKVKKSASETDKKSKKESSNNTGDNKSSKESKEVVLSSGSSVKLVHGIDSESGTSFADALGMLEAPVYGKSKKKVSTQEKVKISKEKPQLPIKASKPSTSSISPSTSLVENQNKETPKLLKEPKLEPLDINLTSLLPPITTNYNPVLFPLDSQDHKMSSEDYISKAITAKYQRTKVFSGNKSGNVIVPSLYEMSIRILQDNIEALEYTGGVPYTILKPVLEKATPEQLFQLEFHNPYLIEDTEELWVLHCQKDFRTKHRQEMESSREMYMRCLDEREAKLKALTANIKQAQDKSIPVRTTKLAYVDSVVKPPRNVAKAQAKNGTLACLKKPSQTPSERLNQLAKSGEASRVSVPNPGRAAAERSTHSSSSHSKPKKAPLMAKTLSLLKNRFGRR